MNAHNEQHDSASPVVKQNLTTDPAAPGIDLKAFREPVAFWFEHLVNHPYTETNAARLREAKRLLALIDASPKGATFPNDANSEAQFIGDGERLNCQVFGGSGHVEDSPKGGSEASAPRGLKLPNLPFAVFDEFGVGADDRITDYGLACAKAAVQAASTDGGGDPWHGLYAPERAPNRDEYGCFYHPDIPSWDDEREESIAPLLKAQGFDLQCVPGDFSDEAMEEGGERYWQEMREWNPEPEGDGWRLVAIYDTEDGPYSMFVKPLAQAGDAEVQP
ncbi:MAG: hypothetical protein ACN6OU_02380 [Stenotrophomonas acidaminiphila]